MKEYDLVIIGAGPAGLMAAVTAGLSRVCVLEGQKEPGQKLLLTGNGQCNLTRDGEIGDFLSAYGDNGKFLRTALYGFSNKDVIRFFEDRGSPVTVREDGKVFPRSLKARDILAVLTDGCREKGVPIFRNSEVLAIEARTIGFFCRTKDETFLAGKVLIAAGGKSYPKTGSRGQGFFLAASLGHTIVPPKPALVPVHVEKFPLASCAGTGFDNAEIILFRNGSKHKAVDGALLITHTGFSGPTVLHISRYIAPGDELFVNFAPFMNAGQIETLLLESKGRKSVQGVLSEILPKRVSGELLTAAGIPSDCTIAEFSKRNRKKLVSLITGYPAGPFQTGGFDEAMVTAGGVSLHEINPKIMESRICTGLFFAGEVMDIDGNNGGYNLQAAFSTGVLAGRSILL